jgi:hypothetical protein
VRRRATTTLILALTAGLVAGCGGEDESGEPIPAEQAAALERQLESIENRFQFGGDACADITGNSDPNTTAVRSVLDSLPQKVDPDVRDALDQSFERLFELVQEQCDTEKGQEPPPVETQPTETVPPEDDEGEDEEQQPPPEEGPTVTEPPAEVPPEGPTGTTGQGGPGGGNSGQGGNGTAGQGGNGGAIVPGNIP